MKLEIEEIDEIKEIARQIRKEITNPNMCVYTTLLNQLVIETEINSVETISSFMYIMEEIKLYKKRYLEDFECSFEMFINKNIPIIYCTYERHKT